MKSKANLTPSMMIGEPHKCMLTSAVRVSEENSVNQVKAQATRQKAIQEMVNCMWDSLHPLDQSSISKERDADNRPAMWAKIKKQCIPNQASLDQLIEKLFELKCDARGVLQFIETGSSIKSACMCVKKASR